MLATLALLGLLQAPNIPAWSVLRDRYKVDEFSLPRVSETSASDATTLRVEFSFKSGEGDLVHGIFVRPQGNGKFPCILLLHGLGSNKRAMAGLVGERLLKDGLAYAAIDAPHHGERMTKDDQKAMGSLMIGAFTSGVQGDLAKGILTSDKTGDYRAFLLDTLEQGILDNRRALQYISTRPDVDGKRIGVIGHSMGAIMGTILEAVDDHIKCSALCAGGDPVLPLMNNMPPLPEKYKKFLNETPFVCCSLYAPHATVPSHMINGEKDTVVPREATERLFNAFPEKVRSIAWYALEHNLNDLAFHDAVDAVRTPLGAGP